jgi:hypothetical protein
MGDSSTDTDTHALDTHALDTHAGPAPSLSCVNPWRVHVTWAAIWTHYNSPHIHTHPRHTPAPPSSPVLPELLREVPPAPIMLLGGPYTVLVLPGWPMAHCCPWP